MDFLETHGAKIEEIGRRKETGGSLHGTALTFNRII